MGITASFVVVDVIVPNFRAGHLADNPMIVLVDIIVVDPALPALNNENPFTLATLNFILEDVGVNAVLPSKCYVCLHILIDFVRLNMSPRLFDTENSLSKISNNCVFENCDVSFVLKIDASFLVISDELIRLDYRSVIIALDKNPIFIVGLNFISLDFPVTADFVLVAVGINPILLVLLYSVVKDEWV